LLCAAFMSIYWVFIYFEGELLSPVLLVTLGLVLLCILSRWLDRPTWGHGIAAGVVFGLYALVRANILLFGPCVVAWAGWRARRQRDLRPLVRTAGGFCLGTIIAIAPVTIRNYVAGKDLVLITTNMGINLYVGNNETSTGTYSGLPNLPGMGIENEYHPTIIAGVQRFLGREMKDSEVSSWFADQAVTYMRAHPWRTLKLTAVKAALFWGPEEVANNEVISSEKAHSATLRYLPTFPLVLAAALFGLVQLVVADRKRPAPSESQTAVSLPADPQLDIPILIVLFILASFISYLPFFIAGRYRVPIIPALLLFAAYGLYHLGRLVAQKQYRSVGLYSALLVGLGVATHIHLVPYRPQADQRHLLRATCYRLDGKIDLAIEECRAAIALAPDQEKAHRRLADLLMMQRNYDEAIAQYQRAAQLQPGRFDLQYNLAAAYAEQNDPNRAITHLQQAIRLNPNAAEAHHRLGRLLQQQRRVDEAIASYGQALACRPDYARARRDLAAALLAQDQPTEALGHLRRLLEQNNNDADVLNLMGIALKLTGDPGAAIPYYRRAIALDPNYYLAYSNLGNALLAQGQIDDAIAQYQRALKIKPDYANARRALENALRARASGRPPADPERPSQ